jgi:hypothetical protein
MQIADVVSNAVSNDESDKQDPAARGPRVIFARDSESAPDLTQPRTTEEICATIADKARADSSRPGRLTHVEELGLLFPELKPEEIINSLAKLVKVDQYKDVRVITTISGLAYLYSDRFISPEEVNPKIQAEEERTKIANKVRDDSKMQVQLTPVASLTGLYPEIEAGLSAHLAEMARDERYQDVKPLVGPSGKEYLYSETHITRNYAIMLARVGEGTPCSIIAETVREESRTYPRPTKVELFYSPVFDLDRNHMETIIEGTLRNPEYADLEKLVASTGAVYLYSSKYMDHYQAERWIEWEEVGKLNNP